ncbi:MAG: hypothetical protein RLZ98_1774 [Pseudomonadota bacterium]|jgi:FMNH2-dependent dimethyl sulfone monooxygenase
MKFGLYAPIPMATIVCPEMNKAIEEALSPLPDGRRDVQYDHSMSLLLAADEVGFDLTLFAERHLGYDLAAWVLASAVGSRFNRMLSLVAIHPGLWDPVMVAKLCVSLDRVCKGRMALNVVNGWHEEEFALFGGTMLRGEDRYQRSTEFIDIMRGLWTNETFTYKGKFHSVENGKLLLKPANPTPPEMYTVSSGDLGRDWAAKTCDVWFVNYPKEAQTTDEVLRTLEANIADMRRRVEQAGRKMRFAINPVVGLGKDDQSAVEDLVASIVANSADPDSPRAMRRMMPNTLAGLIGKQENVVRQIQRYEDMGLDLILCKMLPTEENIRRIGEEVIGSFREKSRAPAMAN